MVGEAVFTVMAGGVAQYHMIANFDPTNGITDVNHDTCAFVAQDGGHRQDPGVIADHRVGMTDACSDNFTITSSF